MNYGGSMRMKESGGGRLKSGKEKERARENRVGEPETDLLGL